MKTTPSLKTLLVLLLSSFVSASELKAQERSIVFLPQLEQAGLPYSRSHRPPKGIGKPRFSPPPRVQSHTDVLSEFANYKVTDFLLADQNEPFVAINPLDPNNLVAGANDYRSDPVLWSYTSTDAGKTWLNQALPDKTRLATATDPSLAYDRSGNVYYADGAFDTFGIPYPPNEVAVFKSTNKGSSWQTPTYPYRDTTLAGASVRSDKYFIAVDQDPISPFKDRIYVTWSEAQDQKTRIVSSFSQNGGATWSPRANATGLADLTAPVPMTAPNGYLFITYIDKSDAKQIMVVRSTDGGQTFGAPVKVANYKDLGPVVPEGHIDRRPYIKDFIGVNSFPSIAIDHSTKANGRIYISWAARDGQDVPHIYVSFSDDNGSNWSAPSPAEAHASASVTDRFFNWIAVDKRNGDVGIVYYDSRLDSINNRLVDIYFSHSRDGGSSFTSRRVSSESFDPHIGQASRVVEGIEFKFFGDYIGVAVLDSNWHAVWTDTRPGNDQEIFTANIRPYAPLGVEHFRVDETAEELPTLRWDYEPQTTFGYPLTEFSFRLKRDDGEEVTIASDKREYTDASVEGGKRYTYTISVVSQGIESISRDTRFIPIRTRKPQDVVFVNSKALPDGFTLTMRIPDKNEVNRDLVGIDSLYVIIDGVLAEVVPLSDIYKGTEQTRTYTAGAIQYHQVKATISTNIEGFRTFADTTVVYLWSGDGVFDYANSFEFGTGVFSPNAWSVANVAAFGSNVINDSLPSVNYGADVNTWFLLPPILISATHRTLEYDHIALVAETDAALVEISLNNGVTFQPVAQYTVGSRPGSWGNSLANSQPVHERAYLQHLIDSTVIVRYRFVSSVGGMDGWFIDNIDFTDLATVKRAGEISTSLYPNPVRANASAQLTMALHQGGTVKITIVDILGRTVASRSLKMQSDKLEVPIAIELPGSYSIVIESGSGTARQFTRERLIVIP